MKNRYLFIPAGVVVITLLITGSLCDLKIAQALFHANNAFSHFMAGFTTFPLGIVLGFILGTLLKMVVNKEYKKKWQNIVLCSSSVLLFVGGLYFIGGEFTSYHAYNLNKWLSFLFGAISMVPGYLLGYFLYDKMNHDHIISTYVLMFAVAIVMIILVDVFKRTLPRLRYTSVVKLGDEYFRPWYLTDFTLNKDWVKAHDLVNEQEIKSFPSGHSNLGILSAFALMFVPKFFPKFKDKEVYFFYGGFLFFLLVAFSRIFIGAHYLSDTMFTGTLAMLVFSISNEIYLRKLI